MRKTILCLTTFLMTLSTSLFAHADFETEILPERRLTPTPIRRTCKPIRDREFVIGTQRMLNQIKEAVNCGQLENALNMIEETYEVIAAKKQASTTRRGWCYEKRGCSGDLVYRSIITKSACTAADGKSWKRTSPTAGTCKKVN